jgi:acyl-CoA thioester hydrolase
MADYSRYSLRVAYHETDAMGVVHHSNHVKYFEEARVDFLRTKNLMSDHHPDGPLVFAVVELWTKYFKTARFDDELEVWLQARLRGLRIEFQYAIFSKKLKTFIAQGTTQLIALGADLKPKRPSKVFQAAFDNESWDEVWPPELSNA